MFILKTACGKFYTGRAGEFWTSANRADAFTYATHEGAAYKAANFNRFASVHGLVWDVEGV